MAEHLHSDASKRVEAPPREASRFDFLCHSHAKENPVYSSESLAEQFARRREERRDEEGRCIEESSGSSFIEFVTADDRVHGFAYAQLINYRLEKIAENEHKTDSPPDQLELFFPTHDVTLTGWRLRELVRSLRSGKLAAVKSGPSRYAHLRKELPYVITITVTPINKE